MTSSASEKSSILSTTESGKRRRLARIFPPEFGRTVIIPVDDSLIFGPTAGLEEINSKLSKIIVDPPDAILGFPGVFRAHSDLLVKLGTIMNLTASTSRSQYTRKVQVGTVAQAIQLGVEAVAIHVNVSSRYESEMLRTFGTVAHECESYRMPLLAIMYPRSESDMGENNYEDFKQNDRKRYTELVAHSARIAVDLGADVIKTQYTGDTESFHTVIEACKPVPVVIAGGPVLPKRAMLQLAYEAICAGGAGVSFGRNVFSRDDPRPSIVALKAVVHGGCLPEEALKRIQDL
jgi:DhnA family fructose-bisphosphate aldolase class Ia